MLNGVCSWTSCILSFMFYSDCLVTANASLCFVRRSTFLYICTSIHQLGGSYAAVVLGPCGFSIQRTAVSRPHFIIWQFGFFWINGFFGLLHLLDTSSLHGTTVSKLQLIGITLQTTWQSSYKVFFSFQLHCWTSVLVLCLCVFFPFVCYFNFFGWVLCKYIFLDLSNMVFDLFV